MLVVQHEDYLQVEAEQQIMVYEYHTVEMEQMLIVQMGRIE